MTIETELSDEERTELLHKCDQIKEEVLVDGESAERMVRLANVHLKLGEHEEAIDCLQKALRLKPGTSAILSRLKQICTEEEFAKLELPEEIEPFWRNIPGLLIYPFSGAGIFLLIGGTIFVTVLQFIISLPTLFFYGSIILSIFLAGYLSAYFISVIRSSARGRRTPPDWPDMANPIDNVAKPLLIVSLPGFVSSLPALAYLAYAIFWPGLPGRMSIWIGLIAIGMLYYPMALIISVVTGAAINSANIIVVVASIIKAKGSYFIALVVLALLGGISVVAYYTVALVTEAMAGVIAAGFALRFVYLYFLMVYARVLGLLYRQCESKLKL